MKKSLIALVALATLTAGAQAQSNVTLYGIIDSGIATQKGVNAQDESKTYLQSGGASTSRWGVRGVEDLGGGLKAKFNLEGGLNVTSGAQGDANALFDRAAVVSLEGSFGEVKMGRQNSMGYDYIVAFDSFGAANIGGITTVNSANSVSGTNNKYDSRISSRYNNAVRYSSPRLAGVQVEGQWAIGGVAGSTDFGASYMGGINFHSGKFKAAFSYQETNASNAATNGVAAGGKITENYNINASYDFGVLTAYAQHIETKGLGTSGNKYVINAVGAVAPIDTALTLRLFAAQVDNKVLAVKPKQYAARLDYALSKRTTVYGVASIANQDGSSSLHSSGTSGTSNSASVNGVDNATYSVGVRHSF